MSGKIIRIGIAGQGRSGFDIHAKCLRGQTDKFKIVAVADNIEARREQAGKDFGCRVYSDYKQLVADKEMDLFVNALPSNLHPKATIEAFEAGHNVLCEKPLANTVKDFDAMVAAGKKSGKLFAQFQNSRFTPYFIKLQEVIDSGKLGKIVYIRSNWSGFARRWDWQTRQDQWGGNLNNTGPHPMDHAIVLFGENSPKIFAKLGSFHELGGDADDFSMVVLHGDGPTVEVMISSYQAFPQGDSYSVSGTRGSLVGGADGLKWKYYVGEEAPKQTIMPGWSDNRAFCREQLPWKEETWAPPAGDAFGLAVDGLYKNLYDHMTNGAPLVVKTDQVRRQIVALEECHRQNPLPVKKQAPINIQGQK